MSPPRSRTSEPRPWLEPELATLTMDRFSDPGWIYERKLDGERCLAYRSGGEVALMTRNRLDVSTTYPEIREALRDQAATDFVCDGEIVAFDGAATSFGSLQQRLGVRQPASALLRQVPVFYYVFDVLSAGEDDVRRLPLLERKDVLRQVLSFSDPIRFTEYRAGNGEAYWIQACEQGWEGLIAKLANAPYRAGRSRDWLKFKCEANQEFVIVGYTDPKGSRAGLGALLLGYYSGGQACYAGKVGTGFSQAALADLHHSLQKLERPDPAVTGMGLPRSGVHWVEPRMVAQVAFSEWTNAGQLRHPRYQGLRLDKDPASVVREVPRPSRG
jgi:bifunctional non-homologous end joining protein LigD